MHHVILVEMITVDFVNIRPGKVKARNGPKEELDAYKDSQKPVDPAGKILIVFSQGNKKLSYWLLDPRFGDHML